MFSCYTKKFSITNYGSYTFSSISSFSKVENSGIITYFVMDSGKMISFDKSWNYISTQTVSFCASSSFTTSSAYSAGNYYFSCGMTIYKADSSFNQTCHVFAFSTGIFIDSSTGYIYTVGIMVGGNSVSKKYDANCNLLNYLYNTNNPGCANYVSFFNSNVYITCGNFIEVYDNSANHIKTMQITEKQE